MPRAKRQKTSATTDNATKESSSSTSTTHKNDKKRDASTIPPFEYICIHRPYFDYKIEMREDEDEDEDEGFSKLRKALREGFEAEEPLFLQPGEEHPDHKWVMTWDAWKKYDTLQRRAKYCDPDNFNMYIYNDWNSWGIQEIMEQQMVAFDKAIKGKDENSLNEMWSITASLGLWLNGGEIDPFMGSDDGVKTCALTSLMGCALLTTLSALEDADELKADSKFRDLALCISSWLEFSDGLPDYGIEGDAVFWRSHAVAYFKKAGLSADKGIASTAKLLEKLGAPEDGDGEDDENSFKDKGSKKDPWAWAARLKAFKSNHGIATMKSKYDITKMSKSERASHAFDKKDPLAGIPANVLRDGLLDLA